MTCPRPCLEWRITTVCQNSCAYSENREGHWNHIYTWAVGGSRHLNDSNFQTIWISVTNAAFSFRIGGLQQLAQAASQCAIFDCAHAPTLILLFSLFILEKMVSTSHHSASCWPTLRICVFVSNAFKRRRLDLQEKTIEAWAVLSLSTLCLMTKLAEKKGNDSIPCEGKELWTGHGISEVASGMTLQRANPTLDIPIKCMKND